MFAKMETSRLKLLAFASEIVSFQHGDIVFNSGDSADYAYVMETGRIVMDDEAEKLKENQDIKDFYLGLTDVGGRVVTDIIA